MPNKTEDELWRSALACFEGHAHRPKTPENLLFALNRIAAKWLGKQPSFDRSNCRLHEERLSPEQLCKLDRHHERASTVNEQEPVVVLLSSCCCMKGGDSCSTAIRE